MGLDFCCLESVGSLVISESCEHFFCWFRAVGDVVDVNGDVDHVRSDIKVPLHLAKGLLKGSFTIFLFSVRSHILDSNEVWYS